MESRITRFAAAAVIIIGVMIGIYTFVGDGTSAAFAQMTENMKKMPWMHAVIEGTYSGKPDRLEAWISFESQVHASKRPSGQLTYRRKYMVHEYEPKSETITISHVDDPEFEKMGSVWDYWENVMKMVSESGAEIAQESAQYEGRETKVYKMSCSPFGTPMELKITADAEKNLPVFLNQKAFDPNGKLTIEANAYFDYPQNGPADIYDIGAPRSAKVINNLPTKEVPGILEMYRSHRESAPSRYIAVVTDSWFDEKRDAFVNLNASIIYRNGKVQKVERYGMLRTKKDRPRQSWPKGEQEIGSTVESQLAWWKENGQISSIDLYDGKFQYHVSQENDKWVAQPKRYSPWGDFRADDDLADFGWAVHFVSPVRGSGPLTIIEDEYSAKTSTICLERKSQGRKSDNVWAVLPARIVSYVNTERDYISQRFERLELFDAPWQEDKSWLDGIDPGRIPTAHNQIREVTEFGQTDTGQWYPKTIEHRSTHCRHDGSSDTYLRIQRIYLKTNPDFPERIFDPENLPK